MTARVEPSLDGQIGLAGGEMVEWAHEGAGGEGDHWDEGEGEHWGEAGRGGGGESADPVEPPVREKGDKVTLRPLDQGGQEVLNELKQGEECTVYVANTAYGNYKLKRDSDGREFFWFKSEDLWGEEERAAVAEKKAAEDAAAEAQIAEAVKSKEELEAARQRPGNQGSDGEQSGESQSGGEQSGGGGDDEPAPGAAFHPEPLEEARPASTATKTTSEVISELFANSASFGARDAILALFEALYWRLQLPSFIGRHHLATFAALHGEAMCLQYLELPLWKADFLVSGLALRVLAPCLEGSDQVCVRFCASSGREVCHKLLDRLKDDKDIRLLVPKVLRFAHVRSALVAKQELVRMRRSLRFCQSCRPKYFQYGLFGKHHPHLCFDDDANDVPDRWFVNPVFDRPGTDCGNDCALERSLVPSGDTHFWFGQVRRSPPPPIASCPLGTPTFGSAR
mmetsp:Transcript_42356/g.95833  ORF Transcript_42356/g.95833 Transcript_42356/m.95833 type:complete len:453 (+) Transcript_42356:154-1512(+)